LFKEERKLLDHISDGLVDMFKFNSEFKKVLKSFYVNLKVLIKKVNIFFNFDVGYHFNNFVANYDKEGKMTIKIKPDYKIKAEIFISNSLKIVFLDQIFSKFLEFKKCFGTLIFAIRTKFEFDTKILEIMKEDKLKNMKLTSLNMNASRAKGYINEVNNAFEKVSPFIEKFKQIFKKSSWEFSNCRDNAIYKNFTHLTQLSQFHEYNQQIIKEYLNAEKGIPYSEGIRNKTMIKELINKENQLNKDKDNFLSKVKEYEDEIKNIEGQLLDEKNNSEIVKINYDELETEISSLKDFLKENNINYDKEKMSSTTTNVSRSENAGEEVKLNFREHFEEFLKGQKNLTEEDYEVLSYDVESGKQRYFCDNLRSSFKLSSSKNEPIQLTKLIPHIENNDISVLYHRKILEKIVQYSSKSRSIDIKMMSSIHLDEVKLEYEQKVLNLEKQLKIQLDTQKENFDKENVIFSN
jgi:hypothetical protein